MFDLHASGIVHGDPRLANIVRTPESSFVWVDLASSVYFGEYCLRQDLNVFVKSYLHKKELDIEKDIENVRNEWVKSVQSKKPKTGVVSKFVTTLMKLKGKS